MLPLVHTGCNYLSNDDQYCTVPTCSFSMPAYLGRYGWVGRVPFLKARRWESSYHMEKTTSNILPSRSCPKGRHPSRSPLIRCNTALGKGLSIILVMPIRLNMTHSGNDLPCTRTTKPKKLWAVFWSGTQTNGQIPLEIPPVCPLTPTLS